LQSIYGFYQVYALLLGLCTIHTQIDIQILESTIMFVSSMHIFHGFEFQR